MDYVLQFGDIWQYTPLILAGAVRTAELSAAAIAGGFIIGLCAALCRAADHRLLGTIAAFYVEITRNTPLLIQVFFVYFALPSTGLRVSPMEAAYIALIWNNGAYMAEILRAGLNSVQRSQLEAAKCLGMHPAHVFFYVQLPPALANVYPSIVSQSMMIFLNSSVVSNIGVDDLAGTAAYIQSQTLRAFEIYIVVTLAYFAIGLVLRAILTVVGPGRHRLLDIFFRPPVMLRTKSLHAVSS